MKFVTFNIRCSWDKDGINSFLHRAGGILQKIRTEAPDVVCFQEVTDPIAAFLRQNLTGYYLLFNQRNADYRGEGLALAVKTDTIEVLGLEFFWLSPTPHTPGSRFEEQSRCPGSARRPCFGTEAPSSGSTTSISITSATPPSVLGWKRC